MLTLTYSLSTGDKNKRGLTKLTLSLLICTPALKLYGNDSYRPSDLRKYSMPYYRSRVVIYFEIFFMLRTTGI